MANNYLQFSLSVPIRSKAALGWVAKTLGDLDGLLELRDDADESGLLALGHIGRRVIDEQWDSAEFQWSLRSAPDDAHAGALWIYAEESGNPEHVALVLEEYLKLFEPAGVITFSWAHTCSKLRVDEFGGGAAVVTATATKFLDAQSWAEALASRARSRRI